MPQQRFRLSFLREQWRAFSFTDPVLERQFVSESLLSSWIFFAVVTGILSCLSVSNLYNTYTLPPSVINPTMGKGVVQGLDIVPVISSVLPFVVAVIPPMRRRLLVPMYPYFIVLIALGAAVYTSIYSGMLGRPASITGPTMGVLFPPVFQARLKIALLFQGIHGFMAVLFFQVLGPHNAWARAHMHLYHARTWRLYVSVLLPSIMSVIISLVLCARMELNRRRLFLERLRALREAETLRNLKEHSRHLLGAVLPDEVAKRVASSGQVAYAEVSDLVGVLVLRFARPFPSTSPEAQNTRVWPVLEHISAAVNILDDLLVRACGDGHAVEKVRVTDGLYLAASNVAVSPDSSAAADPGQQFLALVRFAVAAVAVIPGARAGLHIGRCASGVLGTSRVAFDLFGEAEVKATFLCNMAVGGYIFCSTAAHSMIPRRGAVWKAPISEPFDGGELVAHPLRGLIESNLPYESEPALPHNLPPEPIDLTALEVSLTPQVTRATLGQPSFSGLPGDETDALLASTRSRESAGTAFRPPSSRLPTSRQPIPSPLSPGPRPSPLKEIESASSNAVTLIFRDPALEERYQAAQPPLSLQFYLLGAVICLAAFVLELVAQDGIKWVSAVLSALASGAFAGAALVFVPSSQHLRSTVAMHSLLLVGVIALSVCLLIPTSSWVEFRVPMMFIYTAMVACARPTLLPFSIAAIAGLSGTLWAFYAIRDDSHYTLHMRSVFPLVITLAVLSCTALRYFDEKDTRRSFLLVEHSKATRATVEAQLQEIMQVLRSRLPPSVISTFFDEEIAREQQQSPRNESSPGRSGQIVAWLQRTPVNSQATKTTESSSVVSSLDRALQVTPTNLPDWAALVCSLFEFQVLVSRLGHGELVRLVREFFLVVEAAADAEGCEVVRSYEGTVLVCPKMGGGPRTSAKERLQSVVRVGEAVLEGMRSIELPPAIRAVSAVGGIAVGSCVGAMIGKVKRSFDLVGPASAIASQLASAGTPGTMSLSSEAETLLSV